MEDLPLFTRRTEEMRLQARGKMPSEREALGCQGCVRRARAHSKVGKPGLEKECRSPDTYSSFCFVLFFLQFCLKSRSHQDKSLCLS